MTTTETRDPQALTFLDLIIDVSHGCHIGQLAEEIPSDLRSAVEYTNSDPVVTDYHGFVPEPVAFVPDSKDELLATFEDGSVLSFLFDDEGYSYALRVFFGGRIVAEF
jgi:hypothetical protein